MESTGEVSQSFLGMQTQEAPVQSDNDKISTLLLSLVLLLLPLAENSFWSCRATVNPGVMLLEQLCCCERRPEVGPRNKIFLELVKTLAVQWGVSVIFLKTVLMNQISTLSRIFSEDWKRERVQQDTNWKGIFTLTVAFFSLAKEISDLSPFFEVIYFDIEQREMLILLN